MSSRDPQPGKRAVFTAITSVVATYAYFLLFAQFGFLRSLHVVANGEQEVIKQVLALMGFAGISSSILAARIFTPSRAPRMLMAGFFVCAVAAGSVAVGVPGKYFYPIALFIGFGTGMVTVTLAGLLRLASGENRLGRVTGLGTGVAYAFCNWPVIFDSAPSTQAWVSFAIAGLGAMAASRIKVRPSGNDAAGFDYSPSGIALWTLLFFALVSLDSGAFYVIQHTPELKETTWAGSWRLEIIAVVHFSAAVLAGLAFDRHQVGRTVAVAAALLVTACALIRFFPRWAEEGALLYAAAVSVYSVGLVFYASSSSRPGVAAMVYAVAGWTGSAVGIGATENLHTLPGWFIGGAGIAMAATLSLRWIFAGKNPAGSVVVAALLLFSGSVAAPKSLADDSTLIGQGRAVFISEGCIHCHSQYIRPDTTDEDRWGPAATVAAAVQPIPPLLGNRRQGPDLQNLGNRRTAEWNRLHLISPQTVVPGSRMPPYAYLFQTGKSEGSALLAYLDSLGRETLADRVNFSRAWKPRRDAVVAAPIRQQRLFANWCGACHGVTGSGDGSAGASLAIRPGDLLPGTWKHVSAKVDFASERLELARLIKFGLPGTAMAGHEYLTDDTVLSLAAYVQTVHAAK